jgi:hypothetical protein
VKPQKDIGSDIRMIRQNCLNRYICFYYDKCDSSCDNFKMDYVYENYRQSLYQCLGLLIPYNFKIEFGDGCEHEKLVRF